MPKKVTFEQHNIQAVFLVEDDQGNQYRDALIMPAEDFDKLSKDDLHGMALERHTNHEKIVAEMSVAPPPPPEVDALNLLEQLANLDQQRTDITQQLKRLIGQ